MQAIKEAGTEDKEKSEVRDQNAEARTRREEPPRAPRTPSSGFVIPTEVEKSLSPCQLQADF
jgi:hypothetical protein